MTEFGWIALGFSHFNCAVLLLAWLDMESKFGGAATVPRDPSKI